MKLVFGLFVAAIFLASCATGPPTSDSIQKLKVACNSACGGEAATDVTLYPISELYTTEEAICIKRTHEEKTRLYCGTCVCRGEQGSYGPSQSRILLVEEETLVNCKFKDNNQNISIEC